jgi:hypothetical protein
LDECPRIEPSLALDRGHNSYFLARKEEDVNSDFLARREEDVITQGCVMGASAQESEPKNLR